MTKESKKKFCLNCSTEIIGDYCYKCGQKSDNYHRSLTKLFLHFLGEFFTFDSKFFRSLVPLLIKPGRLTNEYLSGKQASYIAPFRLYFFTVVVFFFISSVWNPYSVATDDEQNLIAYSFEKEEAAAISSPKPTDAGDSEEAEIEEAQTDEQIQKNGENLSPMLQKHLKERPSSEEKSKDRQANSNDLLNKIITNAADLKDEQSRKQFISRIFHMIPNMLIVLMPFFALLLKILNFRWKEFYFVDHFIFSLHYHAFGFLLLIVLAPVQQFTDTGLIFLVAMIGYLFFAQRRVYNRARWRTALKTFFLFIFYGLLLIIGLFTVVVIELISLRS